MAIAIYVAIVVIGALLLLPAAWYIFVLILAVALFRIYSLLAPRSALKCSSCGTLFKARGRRRTLHPNVNDLYASDEQKCPKCGSRSYTKVKVKR